MRVCLRSAHGHFHYVILEVCQRKLRLADVRTCLGFGECTVMVPSDKDLDGVGLHTQPREGIAEFGEWTRRVRLPAWRRMSPAGRGVGDADDADVGGRLLGGWGWNGGCVHA
jgi:hypothetical protein